MGFKYNVVPTNAEELSVSLNNPVEDPFVLSPHIPDCVILKGGKISGEWFVLECRGWNLSLKYSLVPVKRLICTPILGCSGLTVELVCLCHRGTSLSHHRSHSPLLLLTTTIYNSDKKVH